ncbi:MAG: YihA family ribosome biogenesis GTP-binding protein [Clostridia bacterium]|nr:YihA family ribosome biogenesis GTP-binding protein [Clostridia bacterium]
MNIHNVKLTVSAVSEKQYPKTEMPEIAFVGRSNVGKSSLINKLLNRKSLARVSQTPGKTVTINFYNIDDTVHLVDLPGYGYAARSQSEIKKWGAMIENYLRDREQLIKTVLLVDSRHAPTKDDCTMIDWIRAYDDSGVIVVATKTDKLKKSQIEKNLELIWETLELCEDDVLVPFSTKDDEGKFTVWDIINMLLSADAKSLEE